MHIADLLGRSIFNLSGGEKQKIACASVSAMQPEVFVFDEPTSNLDFAAIQNLKETLQAWKAEGKTIVIAEHRLYWLMDLCDRVVYVKEGKLERDISMSEFSTYDSETLASLGLRTLSLHNIPPLRIGAEPTAALTLQDFCYSYKNSSDSALAITKAMIPQGAVIAVIGPNGAGKSTFTRCLCGLAKKCKATVKNAEHSYSRRSLCAKSYLVMQDVNHQLFCESVEEEMRLGMQDANEEKLEGIMDALGLTALRERHPLSLSGGQKQRVAIASALLADKEFLVFDEPTSGLDYLHMVQTAHLISSLGGKETSFVVSHDPELIVRSCNYVLHLEGGLIKDQYPLNEKTEEKLTNYFRKDLID